MSYAGPVSRTRTADPASRPAAARGVATSRTGRATASREFVDVPDEGETDWQQVAIFGAGLALGIALGAGAALLTAPRTGAETRASLVAGAARLGRRSRRQGLDAWDDVQSEIARTIRTLRRRKLRRDLDAEIEGA